MSETMCAAPLQRSSDFFKLNGGWITGACGPTALANMATSALGRLITPLQVYQLMRAHGLCDPDGASTIGGLATAAVLLGCKIASNPGWQGTGWQGWLAWSNAQVAAGNPCVLEVGLGETLKDSITHCLENYVGSLNYHFFGKLGYFSGNGTSPYAVKRFNDLGVLPAGSWCSDGDNWAGGNGVANNFNAANQLQFYSDADLASALPCAGFSLVGRTVKPVWTIQADGSAKDDQGHMAGAGFAATLQARGEMGSDGLMSETYFTKTESMLPLANGDVYVWNGSQVEVNQGAQVVLELWTQLEALKATPAPTPAPAPAPTPVPPAPTPAPTLTAQQEADLAAMAAVRSALFPPAPAPVSGMASITINGTPLVATVN